MRYLIIILISLNFFNVQASHIVGGEIYYDYLGNNNYQFYISVYRDCNSTGAGFDSPLGLGVFNESNQLINNVQVQYTGLTNVPVVFNNPCVTPPNNICTQHSLYTVILNLPPSNGGYTISYQRCCRGPNITNIVNPDDTGFTLTCRVPGSANNFHINSSPRFNDYPPLLLCNNEDLVFDHSATDPDGDELVYSFVTPFAGGTAFAPAPNPPPPPNYPNVIWSGGNSANNPLGPGSTINIDPATGLLTASPNLTGLYVVGIRVQEIRNGVVINQTMRDFLFRVFNCQLQIEAILPTQPQLSTFTSYCDGFEIHFENNSNTSNSPFPPTYSWDFGVPGITTDVSTDFEPSYTYPSAGQYFATLVVNPGLPCTDTAIMEIVVGPPFDVEYTSEDSLCFDANSFNFQGITDGPAGTELFWEFGGGANPPIATGMNVNNVNFATTGFIPVEVYAEFFHCEATYIDSVYIFPEPIAGMIYPDTVECKGLVIDFINDSQNGINYLWDFGLAGTSAEVNPTVTFPGPGTYDIQLITNSSPLCGDTITETIVINYKLEVDFTSEDSLCITDNSFNFIGEVDGPVGATYTWDFGGNSTPQTSTNVIENNVVFSTTGAVPISLTGSFEICQEIARDTIYIYQEPVIDFRLEPGLQCVPFSAQFTDLSFAETGITYLWDFGDGATSAAQHPNHIYENVGPFPVTLTISTASGCIDTLTMFEPDIVHVRPIPHAQFSVTPEETDICHSDITFTNMSTDGATYFYWFDDNSAISTEEHPYHTYLTHGSKNPYLIVTSEYDCKDTAYNYLFIEPYTVFAPNTFTPDGDEFNNQFLPIVYLGVVDWNLQIYNRWGQLIFESNDVNEGWNGTNQAGRVAPDGLYVWRLHYTSCEPSDPTKLATGHITIMR